jgi:hypothetical protein
MSAPAPPAVASPRRRPWRLLALGLLVFVCGVVSGVGLTAVVVGRRMHRVASHPDQLGRGLVQRLDRRLGLSPEQRTRVEGLVEGHRPRLLGLRASALVELGVLASEIQTVLTPEQRQRWGVLARRIGRFNPAIGQALLPSTAPGSPPVSPAGR